MPESISAALITHVGGAHVGSYLSALANAEQCSSVTLVDPDGRWNDDAKRVLGEKLQHVEPDLQQVLRNDPPGMALVTMEARLAPPVIDSLLDAGCHVFAEKPACVRVENGMLGTITSGYYLDRGYHSHIRIWDSKGWLHLEPIEGRASDLVHHRRPRRQQGPGMGRQQIPARLHADRSVRRHSLRRDDRPTCHRHRKPARVVDRFYDLRFRRHQPIAASRLIERERPWVARPEERRAR